MRYGPLTSSKKVSQWRISILMTMALDWTLLRALHIILEIFSINLWFSCLHFLGCLYIDSNPIRYYSPQSVPFIFGRHNFFLSERKLEGLGRWFSLFSPKNCLLVKHDELLWICRTHIKTQVGHRCLSFQQWDGWGGEISGACLVFDLFRLWFVWDVFIQKIS